MIECFFYDNEKFSMILILKLMQINLTLVEVEEVEVVASIHPWKSLEMKWKG